MVLHRGRQLPRTKRPDAVVRHRRGPGGSRIGDELTPDDIRLARAGDAEAVAALVGELGYPATAQEVRDRFKRLDEFRDAVVFVAERAGVVTGVVTGHLIPSVHVTGPVALLTTLVVGAPYHRGGTGQRLARAIEVWAREHGAARVSVTSGGHRDGAHAFYERIGYTRTGLRFTKDLTMPSDE